MKKYNVVIIGAGTAGLTARREVEKVTDNYVVIDDGPLGTTCARVGCMPSKVLIQAANDFYCRKNFATEGIFGAESLYLETPNVMKHVRSLRDRLTGGVLKAHEQWEDKLIRKRATVLTSNSLQVGDEVIGFEKLIIATGSRPVFPSAWEPYQDKFIDTNSFFELETLPKKLAIIGLGVIGLELGQALSRLGLDVVGFTVGKALGGLTDPEIQNYAASKLSEEFQVHYNGVEIEGLNSVGQLVLKADGKIYEVDKAILAMGRRPNSDKVGLENLITDMTANTRLQVNPNTMQWLQFPNIFLPGDVNASRP
ncbi:MAG: FAD-dependent oxidoreductase, partial [Bdellovibrionales bacterium]|nr:FAD-dependent oxidoreductase [Bdellovibrionales bacterium]